MKQKKNDLKILLSKRFCIGLLLGLTMVSFGNVAASGAPPATKNISSASVKTETITGIITDTHGEPLIGATIRVKESKEACATDLEGRFSLKAAPGNTLEVSYVGMLPVKVKVDGKQSNYDITMKEERYLAE